MKQKLIITFSVLLLLLAVFLIARDLFRKSPSQSVINCCGDDVVALKKFDTTLTNYFRYKVIETGLTGLSGIAITDSGSIILCGNGNLIFPDQNWQNPEIITIDTITTCIGVSGNHLIIGTGQGICHFDLTDKTLERWTYDYPDGYITSVVLNRDKVYIADANRKIIVKFDINGNFIQEIGKKDSITEAPGFIIPSLYFDIAFGGYNDLWVSNTGRLRVEHYTETGLFQSDWGKASYEPNGFSGCCNPAHMAILPDGCFVTYEKGIDHIKVFDPTGKFLSYIGGAGSFKGKADYNLGNNNLVKDITVGTDGKIYILDAYNRVNIFEKKITNSYKHKF